MMHGKWVIPDKLLGGKNTWMNQKHNSWDRFKRLCKYEILSLIMTYLKELTSTIGLYQQDVYFFVVYYLKNLYLSVFNSKQLWD